MDKEALRQMIWDEQMKDSTEYCCYCGQARYKLGCCGEVHFETFADMHKEDQDYIVDSLLDDELKKVNK
jgi:hypothetical protein